MRGYVLHPQAFSDIDEIWEFIFAVENVHSLRKATRGSIFVARRAGR
jgi:hypothetical protein